MSDYSYRLSDSELARYRAMAKAALERERDLWEAAGIRANASVLDLGCGPGTFLPTLAERTAPSGRIVGLDGSEEAVAAARGLVNQLGLSERVEVVNGRAEETRFRDGSFDTVFLRNVLVHNGPRLDKILTEIRRVLRPGAHVIVAEPDITGLRFPDEAADDRELEQRWIEWARSVGNDPALGQRLRDVIGGFGFIIVRDQSRVDELQVERSPTWTAKGVLLESGFASEADFSRWDRAIERRLTTHGPMVVGLPVHVVVGRKE